MQADRARLFAAYCVLQEAVTFLLEHALGELETPNLPTPTSIRRTLYRAARWRLLPQSVTDTDNLGDDLLEMLPFLLLQRLLFGCGPDLQRGVEDPGQPEEEPEVQTPTAAASSAAASSSASPPTASEPARTTRRRRDHVFLPEPDTEPPPGMFSPERARRTHPGGRLAWQVTLEGMTEDIVHEAVHVALNFRLRQAPREFPPSDLQFQTGGHFLWSRVQNKPAGPACREAGPFPVIRLQRGSASSLEAWQEASGSFCLDDGQLGAALFSDSLQHFIAARRYLSTSLEPLQMRRPPWAREAMDGAWFFAEMRRGARETNRLEGFHGTSLHMLERMMAVGMEMGWNGLTRNGHHYLGVYFHVEVRAHLCHNYLLYSGLDRTGFLVAPVVCLSAPRSDPYGRKVVIRSSGWLSNLTYPDVCRIHGI